MKKTKIEFLTACLLLLAGGLLAQPLIYRIAPVTDRGQQVLEVTMSFDTDPDGTTYLNYADNQFGEPGQMEFLDIPAQEKGISLRKEPDSNRLVVLHPPGMKRIRVTYRVTDRQGSMAFYEYCCYKPIVQSAYFHIQGGHLLAVPDNYYQSPEDTRPVEWYWSGFPVAWVLHNSFGPGTYQKATVTANELTTSIFVGGADFKAYRFGVKGQPVHFITRGKWQSFTNDTLVDLLHKIVKGHREFWNDYSDTIYSVTFLPVDGAPWSDTSRFMSYGGSGLTNSFLSYGTNHAGLNYSGMRYLFTHELMHRWIGGEIENAAEEQQYWFSEGFTEYFTLKNMLRYGLITATEFLEMFNNDMVQPHYCSPMRAMPNDSLNYVNFWSGNKDWEKLPYRRGCLYAFYLDNAIRDRSNGTTNLDALMLEILKQVRAKPGQKLDHAFFVKMLRPYQGKKSAKFFKKFIEQGEPIDFEQFPLPEGIICVKKDIEYRSGPSPEVITKVEKFEKITRFQRNPSVDAATLKAALLK